MSTSTLAEALPRLQLCLGLLVAVGCSETRPHIKNLKHENWTIRLSAASALEQLGPDARRATPYLIEALDDDPIVRDAIVAALVSIGAAAVPDLIEAMRNPVPEIVNDAFQMDAFQINLAVHQALGGIGEPAVPDLIKLLAHEEYGVRSSAVMALHFVGPDAEPAVPRLAEMLVNSDESETLRMEVAGALGGIGPNAKSAIPYLIEALDDAASMTGPDGETFCYYTIEALGQIGPDAKSAMPALENLQCYQSQRVRRAALVAMESISP